MNLSPLPRESRATGIGFGRRVSAKWVYLTQEEIDYAANTGFIASRNGLLRLVDVQAKLDEAIKYKEHMELSCAEQPLLNYLIVTSGMRYTSLYELNASSAGCNLALEAWAGASRLADVVELNGKFSLFEKRTKRKISRVPFCPLGQLVAAQKIRITYHAPRSAAAHHPYGAGRRIFSPLALALATLLQTTI